MTHKLAGWLQRFLENWEVITKDQWGPQHNTLVLHRLPKRTRPTLHSTHTTLYSRTEPPFPRGGKRTHTERSSVCGNKSTDSFTPTYFSRPKKGWRSDASHQSKGLNPVCSDTTLQDGRDPHFKRDCETE